MCAPAPKSPLKAKALAAARRVQRCCGQRAAELLAVNGDGELRVSLVGVLGYLEQKRVRTAADHRNRQSRAVRELKLWAPALASMPLCFVSVPS